MKSPLIIMLCLGMATSASAWLREAAFSVTVLDEDGHPVSNATVSVDFYRDMQRGFGAGSTVNEALAKKTDSFGICALRGRCNGRVAWNVQKEGFYKTIGPEVTFTNVTLARLLPWNREYRVALRKIGNPIPMYARSCTVRELRFPAYNVPLGYDLIKGDWLPPHGEGETEHFIFQLDCRLGGKTTSGYQIFEAVLTWSFPKEADGVQELRVPFGEGGSVFRMSRYAPESGYASNWVCKTFLQQAEESFPFPKDQNFIFRTGTQIDAQGRITNALYGKVQGPLRYEVRADRAQMQFTYYLNPTPNDRNLEFDPTKNLSAGLSQFETVVDP